MLMMLYSILFVQNFKGLSLKDSTHNVCRYQWQWLTWNIYAVLGVVFILFCSLRIYPVRITRVHLVYTWIDFFFRWIIISLWGQSSFAVTEMKQKEASTFSGLMENVFKLIRWSGHWFPTTDADHSANMYLSVDFWRSFIFISTLPLQLVPCISDLVLKIPDMPKVPWLRIEELYYSHM